MLKNIIIHYGTVDYSSSEQQICGTGLYYMLWGKTGPIFLAAR